jgi:hypothetical protein
VTSNVVYSVAYMRGLGRAFTFVLAFLAAFLLMSRNASAYVDPGTGSYVLQMIVAGIAAAGFTLRLFWGRLKLLFKKSASKASGESESPREID